MGEMEKNEQIEVKEAKPVKPRNYTFMGIAALYLIYLGYELCMGFVQGKEGSNIGFCLMGVVFIGVGIAVVIYAVKGSRRRHELIKAAEAAEAAKEAAKDAEFEKLTAKTEEKKETTKKMSISERARMVNYVEEHDDVEENK